MKRLPCPDILNFFLALYLLLFLFTRLPYFLNYDIPGFTRDTFGYFTPVMSMLNGELPLFDERLPGYPLFLFFCKIAGIGINQIFMVQSFISLLTLICCQYLINKFTLRYRWLFFLSASAFYASSFCINHNTRINPMSLFSDLSILYAVLLIVAFVSRQRRYFAFASIAGVMIIFLRAQGFYLIPVMGACTVYLIMKKRYIHSLVLNAPALILLLTLFAYNKATFGKYLAQENVRTALGTVVFYLDDKGNYSNETQAVIQKINSTFSDSDRQILRDSWSYKELGMVFNVTNWDKVWGFHKLFKSHSDELGRLAFNSRKQHPLYYLKFIYSNFIHCFVINYDKYFFYYNELVNRKYYIEQSVEFTFLELPEEQYRFIFDEYADAIMKKTSLSKTGIITSALDYSDNFSQEDYLVRLNHYYQILFSKIFSNIFWLLILVLTAALSLAMIIRAGFCNSELLLLQIPLLLAVLNHLVIAISIPPLDGYLYPTRFFLYFYPVSILYYFVSEYVTPARIRT